MGAWLSVVALAACGCGRIGFTPVAGDGGGDGGADGAIAMCVGPASATLPPASGGSFVLARAWGAAPNAPAGTPTRDTVELAWEPAGTGTLYTVIRRVCGGDPDPSATTACTAATTDSCVACAANAMTDCIDANAPPAPTRARYAVFADAATVLDPSLTIDVAVPPPNMVLVHRASVNREICDLLGTPVDPTEHLHCQTTGPGAVPLRAHPDSPDLGLPAGFYDFGYDLFVDRWEAGCNWTHGGDGGQCGITGDCTGTGPDATGAIGNVFYSSFDGHCYVMTAAGWQVHYSLALTDPVAAAAAYTNDPGPGHDRAPLVYDDIPVASTICGQITVPGYGAKRPWRLRELVAAGAFSRLTDDPGPLSPSQITAIEAGVAHPSTHACNVQTHDGVTPTGFRSGDELARDVTVLGDPAEDPESFVLGSIATSACVSRYGVQDLIGNVDEVVSDSFAPCGTGMPCIGIASPYDAGNTDLAGFALDGLVGVGPSTDSQNLDSASALLIPLAMPLAANGSFGTIPDPAQTRGDHADLFETGAVHARMGIAGGKFSAGTAAGRFKTDFGGDPNGGNIDVSWGMRCVVAAVPR